ncbi:alpha/beta fold hydrolase [Rhodococcus sp. NPDC127528]|uniref:alpha/beta fold hydrolase n=1 Tax=unclassified Rhodococcus (in: high G+C Gram-positive bacteria) TaxID=192944 RepID=UPI00363367C0
MPELTLPRVAVVLPGTGSDAHFAARAFTDALSQVGVDVVAVDPDPRRVVGSYLDALTAAADRHGPILAGGISIGAAVALQWAARHGSLAVGVLAALPAWTGDPVDAPAALSATLTARRLRADGLEAVTGAMIESSPAWLGGELERSWRSQWPHLPLALDEAAGYRGLDEHEMARTTTPVGICAATDDPVHPLAVGEQWAALLPHAAVETVTLDQVGADPGALGRGCLAALSRAVR